MIFSLLLLLLEIINEVNYKGDGGPKLNKLMYKDPNHVEKRQFRKTKTGTGNKILTPNILYRLAVLFSITNTNNTLK